MHIQNFAVLTNGPERRVLDGLCEKLETQLSDQLFVYHHWKQRNNTRIKMIIKYISHAMFNFSPNNNFTILLVTMCNKWRARYFTGRFVLGSIDGNIPTHQQPLLLTWFNFNPSMDK